MSKNRLFVGIPGYGVVQFRWLREWFRFQSEIAREANLAHLYCTETAYPDAAMNDIVTTALRYDDWDYLQILEHDNVAPVGWVQTVATLDPDEYAIYSALYFGRAQEDQRPIPGFIGSDGSYNRLDDKQVREMLANPGPHRVDAVGMGCTVIHRRVFENWDPEGEMDDDRVDWFQQGVRKTGYMGHDIRFCMDAAKQGHAIWVDSSKISRHIGTFLSDDETYLATLAHMAAKAEVEAARPRKFVVLRGTA